MARFLRHAKTGKLVRIEIPAREMAEKILGVDVDDLTRWTTLIPPARGEGKEAIYAVRTRDELARLRKRAALLRTNMNERAVAAVEEAGLLDAYAALAEDCPPGITAHVWRSYGLIVLMQVRYGKKIGAEELARRANLVKLDEDGKTVPDVETAAKHIRLLVALGYLADEDGRWKHQGLPKSWVGSEG